MPGFEGSKKFYARRGHNYYSVTTIIGEALRKRAIEYSGPKKVAEGVLRQRLVLEAMLRGCPTPEQCAAVEEAIDLCPQCNQTLRYLKDMAYARTAQAADIGTAVHAAIDAYHLGRPMPPWALVIRPRMARFEEFLRDARPTFELSEAVVYSDRYGYAGTLDSIFTLPVEVVSREVCVAVGWEVPPERDYVRLLGDYKSGQRGIWPEIALQLAAYRYSDVVGLPDGSEAPMPAVDGAVGISLTDQGYEVIPVRADEELWRTFLHLRSAFRFNEELSKAVLYPALRLAQPAQEVVA